MDRLLTCEACGGKIVVSNAQAGQEVKCSHCSAPNQVPTLRGMTLLPLASAEASQKSTSSKSETWGWRGPVTAVCLGSMLIASLYTGRQFYVWTQVGTDYSAEKHIADDAAQIDQARVDAVLTLWDGYSNATLKSKSPPLYKQLNDYSAEALRQGLLGSLLVALLAAATIGTIWSAKTARQRL